MKTVDRWHTTRVASTRVENLLSRNEYSSALLLAFIYVDIRLTTMLTDFLCPSQHKWNEIADVVENLGYRRKVELCKKKHLFSGLESSVKQLDKDLEKLRKKRNDAAHETQLWKELSSADIEVIKQRCRFAQDFLKMTAKKS